MPGSATQTLLLASAVFLSFVYAENNQTSYRLDFDMSAARYALLALVLVVSATAVYGAAVHVLTEDTFEHDTQAATGATTGHWFVMFKSDRCHHCQQAQPVFESIAADALEKHRTNIAVVDCEESSWVCTRFNVRSYPTFLLFSRGKQYKYEAARTPEAFEQFLGGGYQSLPSAPVAAELTGIAKLISSVSVNVDDIMMIKEHMPWLFYAAVGATGLVAVMLVLLICLLLSQRSDEKRRARAPANRPERKGAAAAPPATKKKQ